MSFEIVAAPSGEKSSTGPTDGILLSSADILQSLRLLIALSFSISLHLLLFARQWIIAASIAGFAYVKVRLSCILISLLFIGL